MKKGIVFLAVAAAVAAGAYYGVQYKNNGSSTENSIAYVPADTLLFIGDSQPVSWKESSQQLTERFNIFQGLNSSSVSNKLTQIQAEIKANPDQWNDGQKFLLGVYTEYVNKLSQKDFSPTQFGIADKMDAALYTVGALPVMRIKLGDEAAFDKFIQTAAAVNNAKSEAGKLDTLNFQRYSFTKDEHPIDLIVAKNGGFAIITFDFGKSVPEQDYKIALGLEKPTQSLAKADTLNQLMQKYSLVDHSLGFIDNQGLIKTLTHTDTPLAKLLDTLSNGSVGKELADFRTPECQKDIEGIAALWPREVFGYTKFDTKDSTQQFNSLFQVETTDQATIASLQKLRGFLPADGDSQPAFSMGIGLNMENLAPVVTDLWTRYTQAKFTCPMLVHTQNELRQSNPSMLAMGTAMVQSLKGINLDVQKLKLKTNENGQPDVDQLSFTLSVSATQPQQIWGLLGMASPELASALQLPADGQSTDLQVPPVVHLPQAVKLGLYGNHIAIFSGDEGAKAASALASQKVAEANGFYRMKLDYGVIAEIAGHAKSSFKSGYNMEAEENGAPEASDQEIDKLVNMLNKFRGMHLSTGVDFTGNGVQTNANFTVEPETK